MSKDTIPRQFLHSVETFDKKAAFRRKIGGRYVDVSHREALDTVYNATLGLRALGLAKQDRVALLSETRLEWAVADLAILSASCINVPIYPTIPTGQIEYVLRDSECRAVFVSTAELLKKILSLRPQLRTLQHVICFDPECDADSAIPLDALIERGRMVADKPSYEELIATIGKLDWASIVYTSGTTGDPKGAILTHHNFMSNVRSCLEALDVGPKDSCLSFLPLSHVFERTAGYYVMMTAGATIAYAESIDTLVDNLREISPTVVCGAPRIYEKIYARIRENVDQGSRMKQRLFDWAIGTGQRFVAERLEGGAGFMTKRKLALANALVLKKIKARTGGRLRFFVSGGAPLAREINEFFNAAGVPILEGYGLTETSPVLAVNTFENFKFGTVGRPLPGVEIRIADDGEILARGDNVMLGYYKKPEETDEAIEDGWFHTGDVGHLDADGFLVITDRKKDLIVTAGGKNVAPQAIENRLKTSRYIAEIMLVGNKRKFISAVIAPDFESLERFAEGSEITWETRAQLVAAPEVHELYANEVERLCEPFASFERVKKFVLLETEFTVGSDELTPSLKVKRHVVETKYKDQIDALYEG